MKRLLPTAIAVLVAATCSCLAGEPAQVEQWGIFELELNGPSGGNPFTEVRLAGTFNQGSRTVTASGFYDGDGVYRIRFMPDAQGTWTWSTASNAPALDGHRGSFTAAPPSKGNHGPVRVRYTYHFAYADGTPYRQIGTTCYTWIHRPEWIQEQTLATLAASPFNKLRMCVFPQDHATDFMPPMIFPFAGSPPRSWDVTRFNPEFFRLLEKRVGQLRDLGIECDLILFHPYGKTWGFDTLSAEADDRYVRYVVARLAAYRNIWWSLANEFDAIQTKTEKDWDRLFQLVQAEDPYGHLRSIHNQHLVYNNNQPWVTHASMQDGPAVEDPLRAVQLRHAYRKPVIYDEVQYEGDSPYRWAQLSGRELVHRFWCGTVAGTYVGHSEYFVAPHDVVWLGEGGTLKGQSEPRLAFLKRILDDSPPEGIDPIEPWQDDPFGGQPGRYYLLYFGHQAPRSWRFEIPATGAAAGMRFKMDVIDTWNMTVTSVPGFFVTEKEGAYHFADQGHRSIALPGTEGIALRIIRAGDGAQAPAPVN